MTIYVVFHRGQLEKAFKKEKDAKDYVFDGDDVGDIHITNVGPETGGEWSIEECPLE